MSGVLVDRFPYALAIIEPIPLVNHWNVRPDQVLVDLGKIIFEVFQLDHDGQADQRRAALGRPGPPMVVAALLWPRVPLEVRSRCGGPVARRGRASHGPGASSGMGDIDHRDHVLSGAGGLEDAGRVSGLSGGSG